MHSSATCYYLASCMHIYIHTPSLSKTFLPRLPSLLSLKPYFDYIYLTRVKQDMDMIMCMNLKCHCTETNRWMTGWGLKSGAFARLCLTCGSAYESSQYCEKFHTEESGWRSCRICGKPIHCGCIASKHLYDCLDFGGVWCKTCENRDVGQRLLVMVDGTNIRSSTNGSKPSNIAINEGNTSLDKGKTISSNSNVIHTANKSNNTALINNMSVDPQRSITSSSIGVNTQEEINRIVEQAQNSHILAKHKITVSDTELQQMFAALRTKVAPLFEKVLSVSDVSKVGRLVIPKVCAVVFFPYLTESTGFAMNVIDSNGKTWNFQLRFWNNNGGRMYVFENVHGYILESGLQAKDNVLFGVIHPNQLVIGFKKTPVVDTEELELTWGQAQYFLQPDPESNCNIVMIDNYEIEEYDKPPIIGNMMEFTTPVPGCSRSEEK